MSPTTTSTTLASETVTNDEPRFDKQGLPVRDDIPTAHVPHAPLGDPEFMAHR
jgi:hypothetical protein